MGSYIQSSKDERNGQAKSHANRKVIRDFQRKYEKRKDRLWVWKFGPEVEALGYFVGV